MSTGAFCSNSSSSATTVSGVPINSFYGAMDLPKDDDSRDLLFSFPDLCFETRSPTLTDEFEGLYKPFMFPVSGSSESAGSALASSSAGSVLLGEAHDEEKCEEASEQKQTCSSLVQPAAVTAYVPKYKRRKNQQKRVVLQVRAEDLSSDMWAWRKYGQKPIKGSPYPRSYYRCSSTKGCLARRQVEQSCTDPSVFIVTYSGEHNHSQPTRKNALAGTIRHKFPNTKYPFAQPQPPHAASSPASSSTSTAALVLSPEGSPLIGNPRNIKEEMIMEEMGIGEEIMMDGNGRDDDDDDDNVIFSGIKLDDDFFSGLEDIDDLISELSNGYCSTKRHFPST